MILFFKIRKRKEEYGNVKWSVILNLFQDPRIRGGAETIPIAIGMA